MRQCAEIFDRHSGRLFILPYERGYLSGVDAVFFMIISILSSGSELSDSERAIFSTLSTLPPSSRSAFAESASSSSPRGPFIAQNVPPTLRYGRQSSASMGSAETARGHKIKRSAQLGITGSFLGTYAKRIYIPEPELCGSRADEPKLFLCAVNGGKGHVRSYNGKRQGGKTAAAADIGSARSFGDDPRGGNRQRIAEMRKY